MTSSPASEPPRTRWSPPGSPRSPTSWAARATPTTAPGRRSRPSPFAFYSVERRIIRGFAGAALDSSGAQMLAAVLPAIKRTTDWKVALRVGFEELCGFLASEPAFASLRCVDVYGAGPEALRSRDYAGTLVVAHLVGPAYEDGLEASRLQIELSAGAIYCVLFEGVRSGHTADLPRLAPFLTYFALAPFIGAEEACDVANGCGGSGG